MGRAGRRGRERRRGRLVTAVALGYLAGMLPSADLAARLATGGDTDLRGEGSGNPGAANAGSVLGYGWGLAVMGADIGKAAAACWAGRRVAGSGGAHAAGTAAVIGHCYPALNGFRGGKGVATSVGQCAATFPAYVPIDFGVAVATAVAPWWRRRAFAATAVASACWVGGGVLWWRRNWPNGWGPEPTAALPLASLVSSVAIMTRFVQAGRVEPSSGKSS